jgi:hypothetical protein
MAWNVSGTTRPGTSARAATGGTASTTLSSGPIAMLSPPKTSVAARSPAKAISRSERLKLTVAPRAER